MPAFIKQFGEIWGRLKSGQRIMIIGAAVATQRFRPFADAAPYSYLGFSTRSLGEVQRLGLGPPSPRWSARRPPNACCW